MSKKANPPPPLPVRGAVALLALGVAESALSIFQWMELLTLRGGGATVCGVNEHINCETVWNSAFASRIHELLGIPVAGLGLVWGLAATGLAALYLAWRRSGRTVRPAVNGLRLVAGVGVLSTAVFVAASTAAGALCLTCLGTYVLVLAFAGVAWVTLPGPVLPQAGEWGRALQWTGGLTAAAFVAVLVPGKATPRASAVEAQLPPAASASSAPASLEEYVRGLSAMEKQVLADALAMYRRGEPKPALSPTRRRHGPVDAPVKMVEWTDSKCPHCKSLVEALAVLKKRVPEGRFALEARQYPLDGACNPGLPARMADAPSVRCEAAKAQICLEDAPDYWELREKLFAAQAMLDTERVVAIASSGSVSREKLEACMKSSETALKLRQDIEYAHQHDIQGTPLVVVNGREAPAYVPFLYALIMAGGDTSAAAFSALPPPRPQTGHGHEGHAHPHPH